MRGLLLAALLAAGVGACQSSSPGATVWLTLRAASPIEGNELQVEAGPSLRSQMIRAGVAYLAFDASALPASIAVRHRGFCSLQVKRQALIGASPSRTLQPVVELGGPYAQAGYGQTLRVDVRRNCPEQAPARLEWQLVQGRVGDWSVSEDGYRIDVRLASFADSVGPEIPWGIIPISPRTQGGATFEASWKTHPTRDLRRRLQVSAAARATGVPAVAPGVALYLGGTGWRVARGPGGESELGPLGEAADVWRMVAWEAGEWVLVDDAGRELPLTVGRWDALRLDCGRSDCHQSASQAAAASLMTRTLHAAVTTAAPRARCGIACHAVGEPGLLDGGFFATWTELERPPLAGAWPLVHRDLRRLGGVTCVVCHGTSAIPAVTTRWTGLRSAVCAHCHDAPPRYGHAQAYAGTEMARGLAADAGAQRPECARCHTTAGLLASLRTDALASAWHPPADVSPQGLDCVACHAAHDPAAPQDAPALPALLRRVPVPALLAGARLDASPNRVCLSCHADVGADGPRASAALLMYGRGGVDPETGEPVTGPTPHADVEGGCVGCHCYGPDGLERGVGHGFQARREDCESCHPEPWQPMHPYEHAQRLWQRLTGAELTGRLPHADARPARGDEVHQRRLHNVALVLEDPAALHHNPVYAEQLLVLTEQGMEQAHD